MFFRPNSTLQMILTAGGNIGIGQGFISPLAKLHVSSSASATNAIFNGYVGIGTTSPTTKLHVLGSHVSGNGISRFESSDYSIISLKAPSNGDGSDGYWGFRAQDTAGNDLMFYGYRYKPTFSGFWVDPSFAGIVSKGFFVRNSDGNVGIGTNNPAAKLVVSGSTAVSGSIFADAFIGKAFAQTGTSGSTAIYDTFLSNGNAEVYELMATGNPNSAGSGNYRDVLYGKVIVGTGWNGSAVTTYINYVQENPDPRSLYASGLVTSLSASLYFKSGSSEVTSKPVGQSTRIRVKIGSYNTSYTGQYTTVRLKKLF